MLSRCADIAAAAASNDYECSNITMVCKVPTARAWSKSTTAAARHVYLDSSYGGGGLSAYRLLLDFDGGFGGGGSVFTQIVRIYVRYSAGMGRAYLLRCHGGQIKL